MHSSLRPFLFATAPLLISAVAHAQSPAAPEPAARLGSRIFKWEEMLAKPTGVGARRDVHDGPTATLDRFECHVTSLNPGLPSHPPHQHAQEELIIIKEGTLDVHINGREHRLGAGGLFWFSSNDWHAVRNVGDGPATYLVFNFATDATRAAPARAAAESAPPDRLRSAVYAWENLQVHPAPKGERREFFKSPTVTCRSFSVHATTVRAGEASHPPHRHPDEEIIVVKEGRVEVTINGQPGTAGPGSIVFLAANDEHGLRNAGDAPATYYVMRVVTEKTAPAVALR